MTTVVTYQSTDTSAPTLTGQVGSIITLLTACLVNGYGSKSAAGWTVTTFGTNQAVYTSGNNTACPSVLVINDNGGTGAGGSAQTFGAFGGTAVASPYAYANITNPFPTSTQQTNGIFGYKSITANSTARDWVLIADNRTFYLFVDTASNVGTNGYTPFYFGEMYSYKAASGGTDVTRLIIGGISYSTSYYGGSLPEVRGTTNGSTMTIPEYMPQSYSGSGTAIAVKKTTDTGKSNLAVGATTAYVVGSAAIPVASLTYPTPVDGALYQAPLWVSESAGIIRGHVRGAWAPLHALALTNLATYSGTGALAGKSFIVLNASGQASSTTVLIGQIMMETSSTWDTN